MSKYFTITILVILLIFLVLPQMVLAQECKKGLVPCGRSCNVPETPENETQKCNLCHIFQLAQRIIKGAMIAITVWAGLFIVIGAIIMLTSGGSPEKISQGKRAAVYAIVGVFIAFGSWIIINEVMLMTVGDFQKAVTEKRIPWPWNEITCEPTEPTNGNGNGNGEGDKQYCVCEVPVYDLDPSSYPNDAQLFARNARTTKLVSEEECNNRCNQSYSGYYCPARQPGAEYSFSCRTESYVKNTNATGLRDPDFASDTYCILACFQTYEGCANSYNVGDPNFEPCGRECFFMGSNYCECRNIGAAGCSSEKRWALTRMRKEDYCGGSSLWDCTTSSECYCRLSGSPRFGESCERCSATEESLWCKRPAPAGSGSWPIAGIKPEQKGDASIDLTSFLNCFYGKSEVQSYPIVSISDDRLCDGTCTFSETSCTKPPCQHACTSGHYGCGVGSSCYGDSMAVDIDIEDGNKTQEAAINKAAEECRIALGWDMIRCLGPSNEPTQHNNHIHIGISPAFSDCNCDNIQNVDETCVLEL